MIAGDALRNLGRRARNGVGSGGSRYRPPNRSPAIDAATMTTTRTVDSNLAHAARILR
jgi:hypothetical protein